MRPTLLAVLLLPTTARADEVLVADAARALKGAATFFHAKAAVRGGYVYYVTPDLAQRWGEGKASPTTVFVQPPGTPTVGEAFLEAFAATGDKFYLDAAKDAAECLANGQLQSGGWTQTIEFGPAKRVGKYRKMPGGNWNASSLDDDQTQAALRFLARADKALGFKNVAVSDAAKYGYDALLKAQFPNGGFPQVFTGPSPAAPVVKAQYPDFDYRTEGKVKEYWTHYTLNDGLPGTVAEALATAHAVYGDAKYKAALAKLGDFLILAQMPEPQPAWCQQYDRDMRPVWARKFEPPAVSGWESQDALETLIRIARVTGDAKYLEPVPRALAYLRKSLLPDGRLARFYELKSNRPLYMDAAYQLTFDPSAAPAHYGWTQPSRLDAVEKLLTAAPPKRSRPTDAEVRRVVAALDAEGRWVSTYAGERLVGQPPFATGFRYVSSEVFRRNVGVLSDYLHAR
ncbi:MAG TPA: pectate lyase [Urbifossiella sp.]|nr:pectate lyase [Urbifossiella sp.]